MRWIGRGERGNSRSMTLENARVNYAAGDYSGALNSSLAAAKGADAGAALLIAAKCLVALSNFTGLARVLDVARQYGAPIERTFLRILHDCLADGLHAPLVALETVMPMGSPLHPIALYHASCARMMLGDDSGAGEGFARFREAVPSALRSLPFGTDDEFNIMFRQGTLVLAPDQTAGRIADGAMMPAVQTEFALLRTPGVQDESPVVACCADTRYVAFFLPRWLAPLARQGGALHVHVIDPDDDVLALIDGLIRELGLGDRLGISISRDRHGTATSYACARFEIVPQLIEQIRRPVLTLDIDVAVTSSFARLKRMGDVDFACFETGRCEPASVHQASIMTFDRSVAALGFARDLAAYCRPKLHQPVRINWMLDQAALYSVLRLYRTVKPAFRYLALDQVTGQPMTDYLVNLASDAEKHALKVARAGLGAEAGPSGEVAFSWEP
jgi:hypothetical protein